MLAAPANGYAATVVLLPGKLGPIPIEPKPQLLKDSLIAISQKLLRPRSRCYRQPGSGVRSTRPEFGSAYPARSSHLLCRKRAVKGSPSLREESASRRILITCVAAMLCLDDNVPFVLDKNVPLNGPPKGGRIEGDGDDLAGSEERWVAYVADVSGHGVAPAPPPFPTPSCSIRSPPTSPLGNECP
jgi:hypothetical protein